jgi:hypothetical protein
MELAGTGAGVSGEWRKRLHDEQQGLREKLVEQQQLVEQLSNEMRDLKEGGGGEGAQQGAQGRHDGSGGNGGGSDRGGGYQSYQSRPPRQRDQPRGGRNNPVSFNEPELRSESQKHHVSEWPLSPLSKAERQFTQQLGGTNGSGPKIISHVGELESAMEGELEGPSLSILRSMDADPLESSLVAQSHFLMLPNAKDGKAKAGSMSSSTSLDGGLAGKSELAQHGSRMLRDTAQPSSGAPTERELEEHRKHASPTGKNPHSSPGGKSGTVASSPTVAAGNLTGKVGQTMLSPSPSAPIGLTGTEVVSSPADEQLEQLLRDFVNRENDWAK